MRYSLPQRAHRTGYRVWLGRLAPELRRERAVGQLQGGAEPSEQTTVVCVFDGTTMVAAGAGEAGRLLLMQPANARTIRAPERIFMTVPQVKKTNVTPLANRLSLGAVVFQRVACARRPTANAKYVSRCAAGIGAGRIGLSVHAYCCRRDSSITQPRTRFQPKAE